MKGNLLTFQEYKSSGINAATQGLGYPEGDYQAVILNVPKSWIIRTDKAF